MRHIGLVTAAAVTALLAGCASGTSSGSDSAAPPAPTSPATTTPGTAAPAGGASTGTAQPPAADPNVKVFKVAITGGKVIPKVKRVIAQKGQTVRIVVTSDKADKIHVHGYEKEAALTPGQPTTIQFPADQTGLFEVETHESKKVLFMLEVE